MNKPIKSWKLLDENPLKINCPGTNIFYDMYQVEITYFNGEKSIIKLFSEPNTLKLIQNSKIKESFISRAFIKNGLIEKQNRSDYIFLGRLEKYLNGAYRFNRYYPINNTNISAQTFFDIKAYPAIQQLLNNSKTQNNQSLGKHYAISDIHGMYGPYKKALDLLKPQDTLFILGDVIDRGPDGIKILQDIMKQDPNKIQFLLGNHEWQMITVLEILKKHNIPFSYDMTKYCKLGQIITSYYTTLNQLYEPQKSYESPIEYNKKQISLKEQLAILKVKKDSLNNYNFHNISEQDLAYIYTWLYVNHGNETTFPAFANLSKYEQDSIFNFLINSAVIKKIQTPLSKFILVHAAPPNSFSLIKKFEQFSNVQIKYAALSTKTRDEQLSHMLEERHDTSSFALWHQFGYTTIYGHTPKKDNIIKDKNNGAIRIDSACPTGGKLAMYCLDNDSCIYIDPNRNNELSTNFNTKETNNIYK